MGLKLSDFNPPASDFVDAGPAIQRMIDEGVRRNISTFDFDRRTYTIGTTVTLPKVLSGNVHRAVYNGNGATFIVDAGVTAFDRTSTDSALQDGLYWSPHFRDMAFIADTPGSGNAIRYWEANALSIENIFLSGLDIGIEVLFALYGHIQNCVATGCLNAYRILGADSPTGPRYTHSGNKNSNLTRMENCRTQMTDVSAIGFYIEDSSHVTLQSCVTEGSNCDKCVVINAETDSGGGLAYQDDMSVSIVNHWTEMTTACNTVFELNVRKAVVNFEKLRFGGAVGTATSGQIIDASGCKKAIITVRQGAWQEIVADSKTEWFHKGATGGDVCQWKFEDNLMQSGHAMSDTAKWETVSGPPAGTELVETDTFNYS